ncbi:MAG TPA: ABC transporter permease [Bacillota bacterium]|nr:ABC transporter permease [Bacillota bacterium]HOH09959.1 ABC transporter permease [Bacillota bacterium]HOY88243.1 ABC transporter permease [Bacillota bacterium]HPI01573.1 ABC transporter permease [Bacillota bacterium]HPM63344.1 ABC transporter permease [Bacillota bacterium]
MRTSDSFKLALGGLKGNPFRSFLTALGVIIGVAAVIITVSIGTGAKVRTQSQIQRLGSNLLTISSGYRRQDSPINNSVLSLISKLSLVDKVAPVVNSQGTMSYTSNSIDSSIIGTDANFLDIRNLQLSEGTFITQDDVDRSTWNCVLGADLATELFGEDVDPLGNYVRYDRFKLYVVGIVKTMGSEGVSSNDNYVIVPYTTLQKKVTGSKSISTIYARAASAKDMTAANDQIYAALLEKTGSEEAFRISNQEMLLEFATSSTETMTLLLTGIAAVSLLVGGIGIMNIMLVSVAERIREIGIRKAVGAKDRDILWQFILESAALSLSGGVMGIVVGYVGSRIVTSVFSWPTSFDTAATALGFGLSVFIGVFFGAYPAYKGAKLDPIEGLRHE